MKATTQCGHRVSIDAAESTVSDEQLLVRYRDSGDRDLFAQLVGRYEQELYSYLRRYLDDADMAQDVFQAAFLQVHLKSHQFDDSRRFRPWLYTIATNQAIDAQRRNKKHRSVSLDGVSRGDEEVGTLINLLESSEVDPADQVDLEECRKLVRESLASLPDHLRSVITLVYYQGFKYREAAEVLAIPVGTVKSRMHAALQKLTELWHGTQPGVEYIRCVTN